MKYAKILKWFFLLLAIASFAGRVYYGEKYESTSIRPNGVERMDGSTMSYVFIALIIFSIIGFVIFNIISRPPSDKED
jgi:TRAP-type C4-dicarboxylate transport system permease small subunit